MENELACLKAKCAVLEAQIIALKKQLSESTKSVEEYINKEHFTSK